MPEEAASARSETSQVVESIYRSDSRKVLATLIRLLGDFDLAEDALHDAFAVAVEKWANEGVPANPTAWLVSTGRFKAIDRMRRRARFDDSLAEIARRLETDTPHEQEWEGDEMPDDRLRLIFICCHPVLPDDARVALTLREVCGLTTEEIARAFLTKPSTLAQRIVRAKRKIREDGIPYEVPSRHELPDRLDSVLQVVYLVFNEGYSASSGDAPVRADLTSEAIYLGRLLVELLPEAEVYGLLALMLLHESRREARATPDGDLVLLTEQDRTRWNQDQIAEGLSLVEKALANEPIGPYTIQAAISAEHARAPDQAATDWGRIVDLYDLLAEATRSPIVALNRAVAVAMRDGPESGLDLIDDILESGQLNDYHLAHSARADMCRRLGRTSDAIDSYKRALALTSQEPERRFLERRLDELKVDALEWRD